MGEMASAMMLGGEAAASGAGMMGAGAEGIGAAGTIGAGMSGAGAAVGEGGGLLGGIPIISEGAQQATNAAMGIKELPAVGMIEAENPLALFGGGEPVAGGGYSALTGTAANPVTTGTAYNPFFSAINSGIDTVANNTIAPVANMVNKGVNAVADAGQAVGNWLGGNETLQQIGSTAKHFDDRILGGVGQEAVSGAKDLLSRAWKDMPDVVARKSDGSIDAWKTAGNAVYQGGKTLLASAMQQGGRQPAVQNASAPVVKNDNTDEAERKAEEENRLVREQVIFI